MKCGKLLSEWNIEGVRPDDTEMPYMLLPDEVEEIVYLQNGHFSPKSGTPDFLFVDTMWDKM